MFLINILTKAGAIFASALKTPFVKLDNYKYVDFILSSATGTAAETTVSMVAKNGENGEVIRSVFKDFKGDKCALHNAFASLG